MAAPRLYPRPRPLTGNIWDNCIELRDQVGVVRNTNDDASKSANDTAIATALALCAAQKKPLYIGDRGAKVVWHHSAPIIVPAGVEIRGDGMRRSILCGSGLSGGGAPEIEERNYPTSNIRLNAGCSLWNFSKMYTGVLGRKSAGANATHQGISCLNDGASQQFANIRIDGVQSGNGPASAFLFYNVRNFVSVGTEASSSYADSMHFTQLSQDVFVNHHRAYGCGDDGFAVVSYGTGFVQNVTAQHIMSFWNTTAGRGLAFVGGKNLKASDVYVKRMFSHGIYVASEFSNGTYGVDGFTLEDCVSIWAGANLGAYHIGGRSGTQSDGSNNEVKNGTLRNCKGWGGASGSRGLVIDDYVLDLTANVDLRRGLYGVEFQEMINNVWLTGNISQQYDQAITSANGRAGASGGYLRITDMTLDSNVWGSAANDVINLQCSPQMQELNELTFRNVAITLGTVPSTGSTWGASPGDAVTSARIDFAIDVFTASPGKTLTRSNVTENTTKGYRNTGWTVNS